MSRNSNQPVRPTSGSLRLPLADRLPQFIGGPADAVERLMRLRVGVVGCGSVGKRIAVHFARLAVASLIVVDPSVVKPQSLVTYDVGPGDIGRGKAELAAAECSAIHPHGEVEAFAAPVQHVPLGALADLDVIVAAPDNLPCEVDAGSTAKRLGIPFVLAAVHGPTLSAQVRCFGNDSVDGPCPACAFSELEWELHDRSIEFSCAGRTAHVRSEPTMSTSFLCSTAADLAMNQLVRRTLGLGRPVDDTVIAWSGYTHRTLISELVRNPNCRREHVRMQRIAFDEPLGDLTWRQLRERCEAEAGSRIVGVEIERHSFAERGYCDCGAEAEIGRFLPDGATSGARCRECGGRLTVPPFHLRRAVPIKALNASATLRESGGVEPRGVLANLVDSNALLFGKRPKAGGTV